MRDVAIRAEGLGKRYWIGGAPRADSLRDSLKGVVSAPIRRAVGLARGHGSAAAGHEALWALRDASFEVTRGESLGIIGANGAGKSTLLKVLTRITAPTEGSAELRGRVASLLEVGTGFHPDLTGEENIYLNGAILGMTRREVKRSFGEIVAFAGVEKFINTAVKHYSSGMYTRLAFAVAAHLEAEILIVDEVLAVGDAEFQRRCLERMDDIVHHGRTVLFVSHNLAAVESLCTSCLLLEKGQIVSRGNPEEVIKRYLRSDETSDGHIAEHRNRKGNGNATFTRVVLRDEHLAEVRSLAIGRPFFVEFTFMVHGEPLRNPAFVLVISSAMGQKLARLSNFETGGPMPDASEGGTVRVRISDLNLLLGRYYHTLHVQDLTGVVDRVENSMSLDFEARDLYGTGKLPPAERGFLIFARCAWEVKYC